MQIIVWKVKFLKLLRCLHSASLADPGGGGAAGAKAPPIPHSTGAAIEISPPPISAKTSAENGQYLDEKRRKEVEQFLLFRGFKKQNFAPAAQQHFYPHDVNWYQQ